MTDAQRGAAPRQFSWAVLLVGSGVLLLVVGLLGGLAAKRSADIASYLASQPTGMVGGHILSSKRMTGFSFDPSSAHYVPPDYTGFWIGVLVVALGLIVVVAGMGVALVKRRAASAHN